MEKKPYSELTHMVLSGRGVHDKRRRLVEKISKIVYAYPKKYLNWDDDDIGDFFCSFYPKIEGIIDRFMYRGKPFEAYLASSIRWQLKTFAKKKAMQRAEDQAVRNESKFWYNCELHAHREATEGASRSLMVEEQSKEYTAGLSQALRIGSDGKIGDPAWSRRFIYLLLRNVTYIDDSMIDHAAMLCGLKPEYILGCATELRARLEEKKHRHSFLMEKRNRLHIRVLQLRTMISSETDHERLMEYRKQIRSAEIRIEKTDRELKTSALLPTHKDIASVLGVAKGSVDSGLYYLRKAFSTCELN